MTAVASPVRLLIAAQAPIAREGLGRLLARADGIDVVGLAGAPDQALGLAMATRPNVILLQLALEPEALSDLLSALGGVQPSPRVLLLTEGYPSPGPAEAVLLGAWGAVAPDAGVAELLKAIRTVASGEHWVGHDVVAAIVGRLRRPAASAGADLDRLALLTTRVREIARGVASGESNGEIATRLRLSEQAVKSVLTRAYKRLNISNRAGLAKLIAGQDGRSQAPGRGSRAGR